MDFKKPIPVGLTKKIVPVALGSTAMDGGTDPKTVAGIVTVRDGIYDVDGRIAKRDWSTSHLDSYDQIPARLLDQFVLVGERMMIKNPNNGKLETHGYLTGDDIGAAAAPLCDIDLTRYENDLDGYFECVSTLTFQSTNILVLSWSSWKRVWTLFGAYWAWYNNVRTVDKATNKIIQESSWPTTVRSHIELVYISPSIWYLYHQNATHKIAVGKIDSNGAINSAYSIPTGIHPLVTESDIDAKPFLNSTNIAIGYRTKDALVDGYAEFCVFEPNTHAVSYLIPNTLHTKAKDVCVFNWISLSRDYMMFCYTNTSGGGNTDVYAIGLDKDNNIVMSDAGGGTPLFVIGYVGQLHSIMSGLQNTTVPEEGDVYLSLRIASGENEYETTCNSLQNDGTGKLTSPYSAYGKLIAPCTAMVSRPWQTTNKKRQFVGVTSGLDAYAGSGTYVVVRQSDAMANYNGPDWPRSRIFGKCLQWRAGIDSYNSLLPLPSWTTDPDIYGTDGYLVEMGMIRKGSEGKWGLIRAEIALQPQLSAPSSTDIRRTTGLDTDTLRGMGLIPNSLPYVYDGVHLVEQGFVQRPRWITLVQDDSSAGRGRHGIGTYMYQATWEWVDEAGNLWRSVPSDPFYITFVGDTYDLTITAPFCGISCKPTHKLVIWRSSVNGSVCRKLVEFISDNFNFTSSISYYDIFTDEEILENEALYTTGGVLEQFPAPSHRAMCVHQGRMFCADREEEETDIYYSQELVPDWSIEMTGSLILKVPADGGKIMALKSFMDRLIIFKEQSIFAIYGTGPDRTGARSGYYDPTRLSGQIGCSARHSVVDTPDGLMFWSTQGIMLLDRTLAITRIGESVRHWTDGKQLGAAFSLPEKALAMFTTRDGYAPAYNWRYKKWSIMPPNSHISDCGCAIPGETPGTTLYMLRDYNKTIRWSVLSTQDPTARWMVDTGWLAIGGIGGFQRLRNILLLGQLVDHHILKAEIAYDWDGYFSDVQMVNTAASGFVPYDISAYYLDSNPALADKAYIIRIATRRQKCGAFRLRLSDVTGSGTAGFALTSIALEIGVKEGRVRPTREV